MKYSKHTPEDNARLENWGRGHTGLSFLHFHRIEIDWCAINKIWVVLRFSSVSPLLLFKSDTTQRKNGNGWNHKMRLLLWMLVMHFSSWRVATWRVRSIGDFSFIFHRAPRILYWPVWTQIRHSVTVPPRDQQHVDRLGLLYFSR